MSSHTYELIVVLDPTVGDEKVKSSCSRLEAVIAEHGGALQKRDDWGKRRLAYEIRKKREGYYVLFIFDAPTNTELLAEVKRLCHIDESMLRHLLVRAVIGKSAGDPALAEKALSAMAAGQRGGPRRERYDRGDRGGERTERPPVEAVAEAAPSAEA